MAVEASETIVPKEYFYFKNLTRLLDIPGVGHTNCVVLGDHCPLGSQTDELDSVPGQL